MASSVHYVAEVVVAGISESRGQKSDVLDALQRAEELRTGTVKHRVFKTPRLYRPLRELARVHSMCTAPAADRGRSAPVLFFGAIFLMGPPMFRLNRRLWLVTVLTALLLLGSMGVAMRKGVAASGYSTVRREISSLHGD